MPAILATAPRLLRHLALSRFYCACPTADQSSGSFQIRVRQANLTDLPEMRQLQPLAHGGLDDVAQLLRLTSASSSAASAAAAVKSGFPRRAYLAEAPPSAGVSKASPSAFLNIVLVDNGQSAVLTHGRARDDLVGRGVLARLAAAALADVAREARQPIGRTLATLCMPRYSRDGIARRSEAFTVLSSLSQLGFHFNSLYFRTELAPRLLQAAGTDVTEAEPEDLWRRLAKRPDTKQRLFPSNHLLVCRLPMRLTEDNLLLAGSDPVLGPGARPFVSGLGESGSSDSLDGVSFRCHHRARLGRHLSVTAYAATESAVVAHLLAQMRRAVNQPRGLLSPKPGARDANDDTDADDDDVFVSLFFPVELSIPKILNLIQTDPVLHNLPLSSNSKLNCKMHAIEHAYVGPVSNFDFASPNEAIPDDITNIEQEVL